MKPSDHLLPGDLFAGRYRIVEHLGDGGMGSVYRVADELLDEVVALKVVADSARDGTDADDLLAAQRREVSMARRVTHPNVGRVFDLGVEDGRLYITMEFVPGQSLRRYIEARGLPMVDAVAVAHQIASALVAAHDAGVLHLDLKPDNVLVIPGAPLRAVLIDFGIARAFGANALGVGTPDYMAPEQLQDKPLGGAADVYALGLLLYEALTGQRPFHGQTAMSRVGARLVRDAPKLPDELPLELVELVEKCLRREAAERPHARTVERELARIAVATVDAPAPRNLRLSVGDADLGSLHDSLGARLARARRGLARIGNERAIVEEIDAVLSAAPELPAAVAVRALAMVRLWNRSFLEADTAAIADAAVDAVARARAVAPHLADTHLADALIADYSGDIAYAVRALRRALARDPFHAFSHDVLGRIELEAGLHATPRVELAHAVDESHFNGLIVAAREYFFSGQTLEAHAILERIEVAHPGAVEVSQLRTRQYTWSRDVEAAREFLVKTEATTMPIVRMQRMFLGAFLGTTSLRELDDTMGQLLAKPGPPQRKCFLHQLMAEVLGSREDPEGLAHVVSAAQLPMADLRWFDGCGALECIRREPAFLAARGVVERRVEGAFSAPAEPAPTVASEVRVASGLVPSESTERFRVSGSS